MADSIYNGHLLAHQTTLSAVPNGHSFCKEKRFELEKQKLYLLDISILHIIYSLFNLFICVSLYVFLDSRYDNTPI